MRHNLCWSDHRCNVAALFTSRCMSRGSEKPNPERPQRHRGHGEQTRGHDRFSVASESLWFEPLAGSLCMSEFIHERHKPLTVLDRPRELVVACAPLRSSINLSRIVRAAGCSGVAKII